MCVWGQEKNVIRSKYSTKMMGGEFYLKKLKNTHSLHNFNLKFWIDIDCCVRKSKLLTPFGIAIIREFCVEVNEYLELNFLFEVHF